MRWNERKTRIQTMYGEAITVALLLGALAVLTLASHASAQKQPLLLPTTHVTVPQRGYSPGEGAKIKGLILSRDGDDMTIRDETGYLDVITLTADTRISSPSGVFKTEKKHRDVTSLLPGLIIEVKGSGGSRGNLVASSISFHTSALRVAEQIAAGDVVPSMRIHANADSIEALKLRVADSIAVITARTRDSLTAISVRFDDIDRYDARDSATVNFATGKAELTDDAKRTLDNIAEHGSHLNGYLVEVRGYADTTGHDALNQDLSARRAQAVVEYLHQTGNVPLRRILNPTGFGSSDPAAPNDSPEGRAMNRRAEIRLLVNRTKR
jgi:outer membrane protein OmpA-like peptidoglycan-associated protein